MKKFVLFLIAQLSILNPLLGDLNRELLEEKTKNNLSTLQELLDASKEKMEKIGFTVDENASDKSLISLNKTSEILIQTLQQRPWSQKFLKKAIFDETPIEKFVLLSYLFLMGLFGTMAPFIILLILGMALWGLFILIRYILKK